MHFFQKDKESQNTILGHVWVVEFPTSYGHRLQGISRVVLNRDAYGPW